MCEGFEKVVELSLVFQLQYMVRSNFMQVNWYFDMKSKLKFPLEPLTGFQGCFLVRPDRVTSPKFKRTKAT